MIKITTIQQQIAELKKQQNSFLDNLTQTLEQNHQQLQKENEKNQQQENKLAEIQQQIDRVIEQQITFQEQLQNQQKHFEESQNKKRQQDRENILEKLKLIDIFFNTLKTKQNQMSLKIAVLLENQDQFSLQDEFDLNLESVKTQKDI